MQTLTLEQTALHKRALDLVQSHGQVEWHLVQVLQEIEAVKLYKKLNQPSLFMYAVKLLDLSEPVAYCFISVSRNARVVPRLGLAIAAQSLSVSKASRIVSILSAENADELINFASMHSSREIDFEVARRNPKAAAKNKLKPISEDQVQLTVTISKRASEKLKRAESLEAQKGKSGTSAETIEAVLDFYLERQDPVQKAERSVKKQKTKNELCLVRASRPAIREKLTAVQKNTIFARDKGRCTHQDVSGHRCNQDRWVEIHHIIHVSQGGSNEPENLTTLCSFHHDLVHQLCLPLEGQVSWLRSPQLAYTAVRSVPL